MKQIPLRTELKAALEKAAPKAFAWVGFYTYTDKIVNKGKIVCRIKAERSVARNVTKAEQVRIRTVLSQLARRRGIKLDCIRVDNPQKFGSNTYKGNVYAYFSRPANTDF